MAQPAGWYSAEGDPEGTTRYWDGSSWQGEPQQAPEEQVRAVAVAVVDPALRVFGRAIDWLLLSLVLVPLWAAGETEGAGLFLRLEYGWIALFGAILFLWDTLWVGLVGATPGKLILGYRVGVAQNFRAPGLKRGAMRAIHRLAFFIPFAGEILWLLVGLASVGMMFTADNRQSVMDKVGDTVVIGS